MLYHTTCCCVTTSRCKEIFLNIILLCVYKEPHPHPMQHFVNARGTCSHKNYSEEKDCPCFPSEKVCFQFAKSPSCLVYCVTMLLNIRNFSLDEIQYADLLDDPRDVPFSRTRSRVFTPQIYLGIT